MKKILLIAMCLGLVFSFKNVQAIEDNVSVVVDSVAALSFDITETSITFTHIAGDTGIVTEIITSNIDFQAAGTVWVYMTGFGLTNSAQWNNMLGGGVYVTTDGSNGWLVNHFLDPLAATTLDVSLRIAEITTPITNVQTLTVNFDHDIWVIQNGETPGSFIGNIQAVALLI